MTMAMIAPSSSRPPVVTRATVVRIAPIVLVTLERGKPTRKRLSPPGAGKVRTRYSPRLGSSTVWAFDSSAACRLSAMRLRSSADRARAPSSPTTAPVIPHPASS